MKQLVKSNRVANYPSEKYCIRSPEYQEFHKFESLVETIHKDYKTMTDHYNMILPQIEATLEHYVIIESVTKIFDSLDMSSVVDKEDLPSVDYVQFEYIGGIINTDKLFAFERVLWRFFGSNIFTKILHIDQPVGQDDPVYKAIFLIYFKGENIKRQLNKICSSFSAKLHEIPSEFEIRVKLQKKLDQKLTDLRLVASKSTEFIDELLDKISLDILNWEVLQYKYRSVFYNLNKFDFDSFRKCLMAEIWYEEDCTRLITNIINRVSDKHSSPVIFQPSLEENDGADKPTSFHLNKFTRGFQNIVDSYGVATYQEINPAPFTVITFPFLFAVMFGDAGHGLLMALFGAWMVLYERKLIRMNSRNEIWLMIFGGRYIVLLMGLFAIYTGLMYNDIFSKSINLFGSSFHAHDAFKDQLGNLSYTKVSSVLDPSTQYSGTPYPFGIDPVWQLSQNKITFLNSYKMKLSVILGVSQMFFGVVLSLFNHLHFGRLENVVCEFIPQTIFLVSIFGYMNILIFVKWFKFSSSESGDAPSILINLINMFLMKYPTDGPKYLQVWYPGQKALQTFFLVCALLCIPWILFPKVFYLRSRAKLRHLQAENANTTTATTSPSINSSSSSQSSFNFGDTFIHQVIHTIEYCLGSVSHTASYLRLWALSLAHSQLSEVLWNMVMRPGLAANFSISYFNGIMAVICFLFWAVLSIAILIIMEGLSAFLHALRLHWVEFQSKFYSGAGIKFEPFSHIVDGNNFLELN